MSQTTVLPDRHQMTAVVTECLNRYARAVDRCDWDGVRDCYHEDAFDCHGAYRGGVDGFIADLQRRHPHLDSCMHMITNVLVEATAPNVVSAESYCLAFHRRREPESSGAQLLTTTRCRYLDKFMPCADGAWRIKARMVVYDEVTQRLVEVWRPPDTIWAERDGSDPLWELLGKGPAWDSRELG